MNKGTLFMHAPAKPARATGASVQSVQSVEDLSVEDLSVELNQIIVRATDISMNAPANTRIHNTVLRNAWALMPM